jgi:hypothetical protein
MRDVTSRRDQRRVRGRERSCGSLANTIATSESDLLPCFLRHDNSTICSAHGIRLLYASMVQSTNMRTLSRRVSVLLHMGPAAEVVEPGAICTSTGSVSASVDHLIVQTMSLHQILGCYVSRSGLLEMFINLGWPSGAW